MRNPYYISFGRIPNQYISRKVLIDTIVETLECDPIEEQAFKITGIRGTGKTVTMTAIEKEIEQDDRWITVDLKSDSNMIEELVSKLYSKVKFVADFVDTELNLSKFGIGISISANKPTANINYALEEIFKTVEKKKKRVLITIDEARKTKEMVLFLQELQTLIRKEMPVFLIITGLYEDIENIENTDGLTFIMRASRCEMEPLNYTRIREDYEKTLGVSREVAEEMAALTKGYPFCYQALGKYMWDENAKSITKTVLDYLDDALREKVYEKIWRELSENEKMYLSYICQKDTMAVSELLELTKKKHNEWSVPRRSLERKGIIDVTERGVVKSKLPRFKEYIESL